jgi:ferredoxin, 2Fe-2S
MPSKSMEDAFVSIDAEDLNGRKAHFEVPKGMGLSLMEVLKGEGFPILATCGGMALCATCHVQVLAGYDQLPQATDDELDMLESLPVLTSTSRLSCQLKIDGLELEELKVKVLGEDNS